MHNSPFSLRGLLIGTALRLAIGLLAPYGITHQHADSHVIIRVLAAATPVASLFFSTAVVLASVNSLKST